jgi:hypothetical protein
MGETELSDFSRKISIIVAWMPDQVRHDENWSDLFRHSGESRLVLQ